MVFESIVADLLNRFLGDFVDNLDSSQLNIGIWGGDVKLENLEVKETALDDLDLPIKLKFGYLSSLVLKIPWKNLYNEPVIATVDGLHLIIVPNKGVVYNEEKTRKNAADIKQKTLLRLEEGRKNRRKPPDPVADTFAEKMVTQIIKNLQVSVSNIHVRFEDKYTNRHRPFVAGITLEKLDFQTTDDNWIPTIHKEAVKVIHKLVALNNLSIYWNSNAELMSDLSDKKEIRKRLHEAIHDGKKRPIGYKYVLEPIKMEAKLKLNQKPETDGTNWSTPKIALSVDMHTLALAIGKLQYQDILLFLEAQERFNLATQYLKYRPDIIEYKGHYKLWWKFAYTSILEEKVRRRRQNWSWTRMKNHRKLVRDYKEAWVKHQTEKNPGTAVLDIIKQAEDSLDVFNLNVARQQAEMEIDRRNLTRLEDQPQGWVAWGKSWFGGRRSENEGTGKKTGKDIASQFQEAMTPNEKAKLFEAIDYQENIPPTDYPKEFVENTFEFRLGQVAVVVDGALSLQLLHLLANVEQRPSAKAINVRSSIREVRMDGCGAEMLRVRDPSQPWLDLIIDTYPLDGKYDQLVQLAISPVNLKYHAPAVNNAIDVFKPPESVKLNQLTAVAMSRYEEVKSRSVTGLAHAVEKKSKLVLDIKIQPARLMISEGGIFNASKPTVLADLGMLTISTIEQKLDFSADNKLQALMNQAYDKFRVELSNVVICMGEDMKSALESLSVKNSPLHILKPTGLDIQIHKCSIDDLRLPRIRLVGNLPDIVIGISDKRLVMLMKLLLSIPQPEGETEPIIVETIPPVKSDLNVKYRAKMKTIMEVEEIESAESVDTVVNEKTQDIDKSRTSEQQVQVELDLNLNQIGLIISRGDNVLCNVSVLRMSCKLQMRTFDMVIMAELGAVQVSLPTFRSLDPKGDSLYLIDNNEKDGALMKLKFVQANPESPFFSTEYQMTEQAVDFKFSRLNVSLHQQGLMELKKFGENIQTEIASLHKGQDDKMEVIEEGTRKISRKLSESMESLALLARETQSTAAAEKRKRRKEKQMLEADPLIIKMRIEATIGSLAVFIGTENALDTIVAVENVCADVKMTLKTMELTASLHTIKMEDMTYGALYRKLLSVAGDKEMLKFEMTQFQRTDAEKKTMLNTDVDMKVKVRLAQMRFVFLNLWLSRLMAWLAPFQEEAVRAATAAQTAAAEKAAEAAQNVKQIMTESPPRIKLDIDLDAPTIILPRLSSSHDVVVLILGNLKVNNVITGNIQHSKIIMDNMDVKLTEMKFGIGRVDDKTEIASMCNILKPLTFVISIKRNLTFGIVKDLPEVALDAHIPSIELDMSEEDYTTLMQTLSGNLAEGKDVAPNKIPTDISNESCILDFKDDLEIEMKPTVKKKSIAVRGTSPIPSPVSSSPPPLSAKSKVVFQFRIDMIIAVLYTGGTSQGIRDPLNAFAAMRLDELNFSGSVKEDTAMNLVLSLNTFIMRDERREKTKINQLLDKKKGHENERFLSFGLIQNADQSKNVNVKMSAFFICLCPEFLGCLARFFAVPKTTEEIDREVLLSKSRGTTATVHGQQNLSHTMDETKPTSILFNCDMQGVEVILVEDSMQPDTSQALILSFNMKMTAEPGSTLQTMSGGIEKLAVFSSYFSLERRNEITYEVLKSMDIGIDMKIDNETNATDIVLKMSPMELRMSPSIIRLLSSVNSEFAKSSAVDPTINCTTPKLKTYPNYWSKKFIDQKKYWFFNVYTAEEACESNIDLLSDQFVKAPVEHAHVEIERINFTLEAGNSSIPVPLIFLDMLINAEASGWSSALHATADVSLQMSYYNEAFSVWEPIIEPIEIGPDTWERWNLKMMVKGRNKLDTKDLSPAVDVKIEADKILNLTVTKSFISLLNQLSDVFAQAAKQNSPPISRNLPGTSPFIILNDSGISVKILESDTFKMNDGGGPVEAPQDIFVDLVMHPEAALKMNNNDERLSMNQVETSANLRLELLDTVRELKIGRAGKNAIPLPKKSDAGKQWKVIAETTIENGRRLVKLLPHIQVVNHLDIDIEVYSKYDTKCDTFGTIAPKGTLSLAVPLLFTPTGEIYFRPVNDKYELCYEPLNWHSFENNTRQLIRCDYGMDVCQGYFFEAVINEEQVQEGLEHTSGTYVVHLYPPMEFYNILPFPITIEQPIALDLNPGDYTLLNIVPGHKLKLWASHMGEMYCLDMKIPEEKKDLEVVALNTETGSSELLLGIHWSREHGNLRGYLYAPFWLVNNTSKTLRHMESGLGFIEKTANHCVPCRKTVPVDQDVDYALKHTADENPLILPFPSTDFTKKKKSRVQIEDLSAWSDEFPLDTVGNPARITCKENDREYELTVDIKLCQSGLTKIVSFCPFYLVSNLGKFDIEIREDGSTEWIVIPAEKCVGIWPVQNSKRKLLSSRFSGQTEETQLFPITENLDTLCKIAGDTVGMGVCVSTSESSVAIHITPFQPGMAPICVMNNLKIPVAFGQKGHSKTTICRNEMAFFTWSNLLDLRLFEIEVGDFHGEDKLDQNRFAELQPDKSVRRFSYLANFLVGRQRTLLFTEDLDIARMAFGSWETDSVNMQAEISLQGIGLSIVDNSVGKEILYIGISSSDILWEEEVKKGRFKPLAVKYMEALEEKYQCYLLEPKDNYQALDHFEVNLATMIMKKKKNKEVKIRRVFEQGIWANYGKSAQRTRMHFKLNHLQIDNQLETCVFPRVLAVVPPPKSVIADNAPKPFVEISLLQRQTEYSSISEVEYARMLVQEFSVQADQGLINAFMALLANQVNKEPYGKVMFGEDMTMASIRLEDTAKQYKSHRPKSFYSDLHISPLMIHLSFSQGGTSGEGNEAMPIQSEFFKVLFQSVGVSITELQDVVFKLAYFERKCVFYSSDQLNSEITSHYVKQALRQLYVLVLGLDIIGNPFGLVRDLSAGVEDLFYQPFQGLVQGPEEFATGVAIGVQSMFGHAVGGAAGAVGRITGTVGKGVAALTFDSEYQRKRQEDLNRRPQTFGEGMARGVKGLGMGVVDGITGVVTKPIEGARQEGGLGFVKGVGKGLIGVVTRPVSGVVDFASSTLNSVRNVAGTSREANALRPPRVIRADHLVRPYSLNEAQGFKIFNDTERGELAETDEFITYAPITEKIVLLVTNKQLVLAKRTDVMGTWVVDWQIGYEKIHEPKIIPNGIKILLKEKKRGFLGIGSSEGKMITFQNPESIQLKLLTAYKQQFLT